MAELNATSTTTAGNVTNLKLTSTEHHRRDICLKCGNTIPHIPYKYNGQTFHARCLVCNQCGRKLIGKPFVTKNNQIYCGDQCKQYYEQNPSTVSVLSNDNNGSEENNDGGQLNESLLDALESIKESKQDIMRLAHQASPTNSLQDPDRITDYPRRTSPNVSLLSLSSRRSSLSAMSQSSFTSDSSFDANKRPGKKILKNPHRSVRSSKHRVTWRLPNTGDGTGIDSDTTSIDSLDSSSSSIYNRARSGVQTTRQTWRDFENSPPRGSTGITPIKPTQKLPLTRSSSATGVLQMYSLPSNLATIPQGAVVNHLESTSSEILMRSKLTPSQLAFNTSSNNSVGTGNVLHSTPIRHSQSSSDLEIQNKLQQHGSIANQAADISILRLDNSNLTDLEESTLEDRKRMHIFQFPQTYQQRNLISKQPVALFEDDDASDYDHLSPLYKNEGSREKRKGVSVYPDRNIKEVDTAKNIVEAGHGDNESHKSASRQELPSSIPPKRGHQERKAAIGSEVTRTLSKPESISSLSQQQFYSTRQNTTLLSPQNPPPVPPKMRRKKQQNTFTTSSNTNDETHQRRNSRQRDKILSPPCESVVSHQQSTSILQSHGSTEEDLTSSISSTTLVEEENTKSMSSRSHAALYPATATVYQQSSQHTEAEESWSGHGIKDRIVVGTEAPGPSLDKLFKISANQFRTTAQSHLDPPSQRREYHFQDNILLPESHSRPDTVHMDIKLASHYHSQQAYTQDTCRAPEETLTDSNSPCYKTILETAFVDGSVMKGNSPKYPVTTQQPNEKSLVQQTHRPHKSVMRSSGIGLNSQAASLDAYLSPQEQEVRKRFYSGGKVPMEKPVMHVKNQSVAQLLKELEINDDKKHAATVACKVCKKNIQGSSYTMNGENYHSKCYKCATCGSVLRGKKSFTLGHKLLCKDCHAHQERSLGHADNTTSQYQAHHRKNFQFSHDFQTSGAVGRKITSV